MTNDRIKRRIERLLDQADEAEASSDWGTVNLIAQDILDLDPGTVSRLHGKALMRLAKILLESGFTESQL